MTKEELAARLNGRQMGEEITNAEEALANTSGLVVLFGYSDDNAEFRGAIHGEEDCYNSNVTNLLVGKTGILDAGHEAECGCKYCGFDVLKKQAKVIKATFGKDGWSYETAIPHATFDVLEGGDTFCRGIVFSVEDL